MRLISDGTNALLWDSAPKEPIRRLIEGLFVTTISSLSRVAIPPPVSPLGKEEDCGAKTSPRTL